MSMRVLMVLILLPLALACRQAQQTLEELEQAAGVDTLEAPGEPHRIVIQAASYAFQPSEITVPRGAVRFVVVNGADEVHAFEVEGHGIEEETGEIQPGTTDSLTVTFEQPGDYVLYCPVADHRQRGMTGTLTVQ